MPLADLLMSMQGGCEKDCKAAVQRCGCRLGCVGEADSQAPDKADIGGAPQDIKNDGRSRMPAYAFLSPTNDRFHVGLQINPTFSSFPPSTLSSRLPEKFPASLVFLYKLRPRHCLEVDPNIILEDKIRNGQGSRRFR